MGSTLGKVSRNIESVIIDEGFGSLDKHGRQEMIDELMELQKVLKRIIVVSHQEDFASAFPNRWEISLVGGTIARRSFERVGGSQSE